MENPGGHRKARPGNMKSLVNMQTTELGAVVEEMTPRQDWEWEPASGQTHREGREGRRTREGSGTKAWAREASRTKALVWRWKRFPNTTLQSLHLTSLNYKESNELLKWKRLGKAAHCKTKVKNIHYIQLCFMKIWANRYFLGKQIPDLTQKAVEKFLN